MEDNTKENGLIIIWKEWESILGKMAEAMKANTKMIRNMATVSTLGPIQDNIKDGGSEVSSTDLENTAFLAKTLSSASGKTERGSNGSTIIKLKLFSMVN